MDLLQQVCSLSEVNEMNDEFADRPQVRRRFSMKQIGCSLEASKSFSDQLFTIFAPSSAVYHPIFAGTVLTVVQ